MNSELATIFSSALLLLAVYFWYDTMRMILVNRNAGEIAMIVFSVIITILVIWIVVYLKNAFPSTTPPENMLQPPPPDAKTIVQQLDDGRQDDEDRD